MNILFIKHFCVGFMVSEILRVSVFGHCPYSGTFPYTIMFHWVTCQLDRIRYKHVFKIYYIRIQYFKYNSVNTIL